ncbi:hypothetical protein HAX54_040140 [Datura stramonium]|uniref:Uncharacterized protein n=1 Tax=Datura stramonium TaxID=4076 RepID=A0ABS8SJS3_DATST|nr:hypothetical protein [Datura stramonium]
MQDAEMNYAYSPFDAGRTPYYYDQDPFFHPSSHHGYRAFQPQCPYDQSSWDEKCNSIQDWNLEPTFDSKGSRSGKVLQLKPDISMEEETYAEEELSPNIMLAPRKVTDEASIEEVNEEPKMEVSIPL